MRETVLTRYIGCTPGADKRAYAFGVREGSGDWREFIFTIPNEAFQSHRARYQDAPAICSLRLKHELSATPGALQPTRFGISDTELEDFSRANKPKSSSSPYAPKPAQNK